MAWEGIDLYNVISRNVAQIGYDNENNVLCVVFNNGRRYEYYNVPPDVWESFMTAESKGRFVHTNLKGFYDYGVVSNSEF
jgi:hypothetical protein